LVEAAVKCGNQTIKGMIRRRKKKRSSAERRKTGENRHFSQNNFRFLLLRAPNRVDMMKEENAVTVLWVNEWGTEKGAR
jgi:hypothetical protein